MGVRDSWENYNHPKCAAQGEGLSRDLAEKRIWWCRSEKEGKAVRCRRHRRRRRRRRHCLCDRRSVALWIRGEENIYPGGRLRDVPLLFHVHGPRLGSGKSACREQ